MKDTPKEIVEAINTELSKVSLIDWILSRPEGKQFLAATLIAILALAACIIKQEIRLDKKNALIQSCQEDKQQMKKEDDERFFNFLIRANENAEQTKLKYDSLNAELIKILKK